MLYLVVGIIEFRAHVADIRTKSLGGHLSKPTGVDHTDVIIKKEKNLAAGFPRRRVIHRRVVERAGISKNADSLVFLAQVLKKFQGSVFSAFVVNNHELQIAISVMQNSCDALRQKI